MGRTMAELFAEENASVILTTHRHGKLNQVKEFNGAPSVVRDMIANPERLCEAAVGETIFCQSMKRRK